jgi:hypothetical protein
MYPTPGIEACMLNGKLEYYCIKVNWKCFFNVVGRRAASEMVKWKMGLSCQVFFNTTVLESMLILAWK